MPATTDRALLPAALDPVVRDGEYVYCTVSSVAMAHIAAHAHAVVREDEGTTVILARPDADAAGLDYTFVAAWITLSVPSALNAVGLTAAFSAALAEAGISCNVLAGAFHDHLLVPSGARESALQVLRRLAPGDDGRQPTAPH